MLSTPVGLPSNAMAPVRLPDLGRVGWTLARAFVPRRSVVLAALVWPVLTFVMSVQPGLLHDGGDVVVTLHRRGANPSPRAVGRLLVLAVGAGLAVALVAVVAESVTGSSLAGWVVATAWPAAGFLLLAWSVVVTNVHVTRVHRAALRSTGAEQRRADRAALRAADWWVGSFAARPGAGGLPAVVREVRATVPAGRTVAVVAVSEQVARVYGRYGLRPLPSLPFALVATAPGPTPDAPSHMMVPHREMR